MLFTAIEALAKLLLLIIIFIISTPIILLWSFFGKEKYFKKLHKSYKQVATTSLNFI